MGGNVFKNSEPFRHEQIPAIAEYLDKLTHELGIKIIPIGSNAVPTPGKISGDYDAMIDERALSFKFNIKDPKKIRRKLKEVFDEMGAETKLNSIAVHVNVPVDGHHYQADVMVTPNATNISKLHIHKIPAGSPYKGLNKHIALNVLAKRKGLLWSTYQGLYSRNAEGKRGRLITDDADQIAYLLLGPDSSEQSLDCLENMLATLTTQEADELLTQIKQDPNWKEFA